LLQLPSPPVLRGKDINIGRTIRRMLNIANMKICRVYQCSRDRYIHRVVVFTVHRSVRGNSISGNSANTQKIIKSKQEWGGSLWSPRCNVCGHLHSSPPHPPLPFTFLRHYSAAAANSFVGGLRVVPNRCSNLPIMLNVACVCVCVCVCTVVNVTVVPNVNVRVLWFTPRCSAAG
jgi:hypothetical protein